MKTDDRKAFSERISSNLDRLDLKLEEIKKVAARLEGGRRKTLYRRLAEFRDRARAIRYQLRQFEDVGEKAVGDMTNGLTIALESYSKEVLAVHDRHTSAHRTT